MPQVECCVGPCDRRWAGAVVLLCVPQRHGQPLQPVDGDHAGGWRTFPIGICMTR